LRQLVIGPRQKAVKGGRHQSKYFVGDTETVRNLKEGKKQKRGRDDRNKILELDFEVLTQKLNIKTSIRA